MDWTACELVERVDGRCGGRPTLVGTRIWPETFIESAADGMTLQEMHDQFPSVSLQQIQAVLDFARKKHTAA